MAEWAVYKKWCHHIKKYKFLNYSNRHSAKKRPCSANLWWRGFFQRYLRATGGVGWSRNGDFERTYFLNHPLIKCYNSDYGPHNWDGLTYCRQNRPKQTSQCKRQSFPHSNKKTVTNGGVGGGGSKNATFVEMSFLNGFCSCWDFQSGILFKYGSGFSYQETIISGNHFPFRNHKSKSFLYCWNWRDLWEFPRSLLVFWNGKQDC